MLLFGHVGFNIGLAFVIERALKKIKGNNFKFNFDYGLVALESMVPDIIDKPLGEGCKRAVFFAVCNQPLF